MYRRLLQFICCPECRETLELLPLDTQADGTGEDEIETGLLTCEAGHWYPIVRGIPRLLPDSLRAHWQLVKPYVPQSVPPRLQSLPSILAHKSSRKVNYHRATQEHFSYEWEQHELGDRTWGMKLADRVLWFFLLPLRRPATELRDKVLLDAGCGNGSQSVAYTEYGLEVLAIDLSTGLEHGHAYRRLHPGARPRRVHFIQGNLQQPPVRDDCVDIIHSAGVLHHTPDTRQTFRALLPLLRAGGTFYVWLYKHERFVTPLVNSIRAVTTRIPPIVFASVAQVMTVPFMLFCTTVNALGLRSYAKLNRREAALALLDIFGAPYAHAHSYSEVADWYRAAG